MPRTEAFDTAAKHLVDALAADAPALHSRLLAVLGTVNQQRSPAKLPDFTPADFLWDLLATIAIGPETATIHQQITDQKQAEIPTTVHAQVDALKAAL